MKILGILALVTFLATSCSPGEATNSLQANVDPTVALANESEKDELAVSFEKADPSAEGLAAIFPSPAIFGEEWILDAPVNEYVLLDGEFRSQSDEPVPQPEEWTCDTIYAAEYYGTFSEFTGTYSLNTKTERTIVMVTVRGVTSGNATTLFDLDAFGAECLGEVSNVAITCADSAIRYSIDPVEFSMFELMPNNERITVRKDDVLITVFISDKTKLRQLDTIVDTIASQLP